MALLRADRPPPSPGATEDAAADAAAIALVLAGDTGQFRAVVERHQVRLQRIIHRLVGHPEDAAELTQQALLAAFSALGRYDPLSPFSPWLVRIGVNLAKDHLRSSRRREVLGAADELEQRSAPAQSSPERSLADLESRRSLWIALQTLHISDREILVLKDVEELSYEEIRAILGSPITALKIRALRARQRLRAALARVAPDERPGP